MNLDTMRERVRLADLARSAVDAVFLLNAERPSLDLQRCLPILLSVRNELEREIAEADAARWRS